MDTVDIYLHTSIRGLKKRNGFFWYVLEMETSKGLAQLSDKKPVYDCTENEAQLRALLAAAKRLTKPCELHIYTDSTFVAAGWTEGWIRRWREKGWKTKKGTPVAFLEQWQELDQLMGIHLPVFHTKEHHPYSTWFQFEEKRKENSYV